ncbi:MAG: LegC family aminotransferase [Deltaproteobacteria bacterium]|nr:MAG: LegC family aminotransferase [Deltaproteobacteria bacterium]
MCETRAGKDFIPLSVPCLNGNEWTYVKECLDTNWVSSVGSFVERFEGMAAGALGVRHAVATVTGTAALHVALKLAGVEAGDEVAVSDLTFIAPANAVRYLGAWPVFVDAEPKHWQMDPQKLRDFLRKDCDFTGGVLKNRRTGRRVAALLPVHILGHPCDMGSIMESAEEFGIPVVEDATESMGVAYKGRSAGSFGKMACLSFNGNKILTTGGGGMIVTDDAVLARRARYLTTQAKDDDVEFIHGEVGYNYRLSNVLAAIGVAQMERLESHVAAKRATAEAYTKALFGIPGVRCPEEPEGARSTFWLYTVLVDEKEAGADSRALMRRLEGAGIQTRPLWQPMHLSPAHRGSYATDCSVAERLNRQAISLPCSVGIGEKERTRVVESVRAALRRTPDSKSKKG